MRKGEVSKDKKSLRKNNRGITLMTLVITIIVLIILATVTIRSISGNDGIVETTVSAKEKSEINSEMKIVDVAVNQAKNKNKYGDLEESDLKDALTKNLEGKNEEGKDWKIESYTESGKEYYIITFLNSQRSYKVSAQGNLEYIAKKEDIALILANPKNGIVPRKKSEGYSVEITVKTLQDNGLGKLEYAWSRNEDEIPEEFVEQANASLINTSSTEIKTSVFSNRNIASAKYYLWIKATTSTGKSTIEHFGPYVIGESYFVLAVNPGQGIWTDPDGAKHSKRTEITTLEGNKIRSGDELLLANPTPNPQSYTVTFKNGEISLVTEKADITFDKWVLSEDATGTLDGKTYKFVEGEGEVTATYSTASIKTPTREEMENKAPTGKELKEWEDEQGNKIQPGEDYTPTGDTEIIAIWSNKKYEVAYDYKTNGGNKELETKRVEYEQSVDLTAPNTDTKPGYEFVGWNTNKNATTGLTSLTMGANDITLYAIYKKDITLTFIDYKGTEKTTTQKNLTIYNNKGGEETAPVINTYTGWTSRYWTIETSADGIKEVEAGTKISNIKKSNTYYARYTKQITVSFDLNGGSGTKPEDIKGNIEINSYEVGTEHGITVTMPTVTTEKIGHSFTGWNTNAQGTGTYTYEDKGTGTFGQDTTLYAKWVINTSHLTIDPAGGSVTVTSPTGGQEETITQEKTYTQQYNSSLSYGVPTRENDVEIRHWTITLDYNDNTTPNGTLTSDVTFTTTYTFNKWEKQEGFKGTLSSETEAGTYIYPPDKNVTSKIIARYTSNLRQQNGEVILPTPTRTGYTFKCWKSSVNGLEFAGGETIWPGHDNTLVAQWEANKYKINFYQGNGTSTAGATKLGELEVTYDSPATLTSYTTLGGIFPYSSQDNATNGNPNHHWRYYGWSDTQTGTTRKYEDGQTISVYNTAGDTNLYAIGDKNFFFYSGIRGMTGSGEIKQYWNPYSTSNLTALIVPEATAISGWTFVGYKTAMQANSTVDIAASYVGKQYTPEYNSGQMKRSIYKRTLTLNYNGNSSTGGSTSGSTAIQYYHSGNGASGAQNDQISTPSFTLATNGFTKTGHTFKGWGETASATTKYSAGAAYNQWIPAVDNSTITKTMYAQWEANKYKITFYQGHGASSVGSAKLGEQEVTYGQSVTLSSYADLGGIFPYSAEDRDTNDADYHFWHFYGWNTTTTGTTREYNDSKTFTYNLTGNLKLYAIGYKNVWFWAGIAPTASLGKFVQYWNPCSNNNNYLTGIDIPTPTSITGWEFMGYKLTSAANSNDIVVQPSAVGTNYKMPYSSDQYLRAVYKRTLTLKYDKNGGTGSTSNTTQTQYYNSGISSSGTNIGAKASTPSFTLRANGFTRTNYTFEGWGETASATTVYDAGSVYTGWVPAVNITTTTKTMYAQWIQTPKKTTIKFYKNNSNATGTMTQQVINAGKTAKLKKNTFAVKTAGITSKQVFSKWNTKRDGTGTSYADEKQITAGSTETTIELYAQWVNANFEVSDPVTYTTYFNDAVAAANNATTIKVLNEVTETAAQPTVTLSKSLYLNLNGKTLTRNTGIVMGNGKNFIVQDGTSGGGTLACAGDITIKNAGSGNLTIRNTAQVTNNTQKAPVYFTTAATGKLTISNNAKVYSTKDNTTAVRIGCSGDISINNSFVWAKDDGSMALRVESGEQNINIENSYIGNGADSGDNVASVKASTIWLAGEQDWELPTEINITGTSKIMAGPKGGVAIHIYGDRALSITDSASLYSQNSHTIYTEEYWGDLFMSTSGQLLAKEFILYFENSVCNEITVFSTPTIGSINRETAIRFRDSFNISQYGNFAVNGKGSYKYTYMNSKSTYTTSAAKTFNKFKVVNQQIDYGSYRAE